MEKFQTITSSYAPLRIRDVDTDMLIPAQYLTSTVRGGYGENLFRRLRDQDPEFVLNRPEYRSAKILVADSNFGCGSSREHAVWALREWGIRAVIAPSFADIFAGNAVKNGLLLITLDPAVTQSLLAQSGLGESLTINLSSQTVTKADGSTYQFAFDPFRKHCLLEGLDDLDYILSYQDAIAAHFAKKDPLIDSTRTKANG